MSEWASGTLADAIASLDAGVSVNAEDRPHGAGEIGVLKTSAISGGAFRTEQNKSVLQHERRLVAEPVQADSILVSRMNTPALVGESCYVREAHPTLFLPDRLWQLKPRDRAQLNMRWLSFVLQSADYRRYVEVHATGTSGSMKNLPKSKLLALPVQYPEPAEQSVIAQILDTLDTAIRETDALIDKLKAVKQGLLHDLLTRGIDANGQLRPPQSEAPQLYKESPLGWIPREWDCTAVAAIADVKSGATPSREMAHLYYAATGINWVKTLDLNEDLIFETDERITAQGLRGSSCVEFPAGTVLVAMYGGWEQIGRTGLLAVKAATNQAISSLLFRTEHVFPEFILRAMQHGRPRWQQVAASTRKDPNITKADVMEFLLPVPPKPEQEVIAGRYRSVLDQLQIEQQQALKLKQQKSGLMDDLLTGRVRVTPLLESMQQAAASTGA
jgi:type I restriction enzyme S subunit